MTATPKRGDNIGLEAVFSKIAFERNMREMIEAGWLCRLRGIRVKSETDLDSVSTRAVTSPRTNWPRRSIRSIATSSQ